MFRSRVSGLLARNTVARVAVVVVFLIGGGAGALASPGGEPDFNGAAGAPPTTGPTGTRLAAAPRLLPRRHDFGSLHVEETAVFAFRLAAGSAPLATRVRLSNTKDYRLRKRCPALLEPRRSCRLVITFAPTATGRLPATLELIRPDGSRLRASLAGRGMVVRPTLAPSSRSFGTVDVATGQSARATFTVSAASRRLVVRPRLSSAGDFAIVGGCRTGLRAHQSCAVTVSFAPKASGRRTARLTIALSGGSKLVAALSGSGRIVAPTLTPSSHDFGTFVVGRRSAPVTFRLTAGSLPLTKSAVQTSNGREFPIDAASCPQTLQPGSGCSIDVTFAPADEGRRSATLSASTGTVYLLTSRVTGLADGSAGFVAGPSFPDFGPAPIGTAVFGVGPTSLDFASVLIGATSTKSVVINGHGPGSMRVARISLTGADDFAATNNCPATLAEGSSCVVRVRFTAALPAGRKTGALTVENETGSSIDVTLTATAHRG
jgi:hypothetical protein